MKTLNDYPTPETDAVCEQVPAGSIPAVWNYDKAINHARDLERKFLMCRAALETSHDLMRQLKPLVNKTYSGAGDVFFECAIEDNEKALAATAPK